MTAPQSILNSIAVFTLTYIQPTEKGLEVLHALVNHPKGQHLSFFIAREPR